MMPMFSNPTMCEGQVDYIEIVNKSFFDSGAGSLFLGGRCIEKEENGKREYLHIGFEGR